VERREAASANKFSRQKLLQVARFQAKGHAPHPVLTLLQPNDRGMCPEPELQEASRKPEEPNPYAYP